mmetsp:Transcript_14420/g.62539  ORF Transcript_14420/g.62539 Transcript_14420/m.62539 type:complete len:231 (-) Transcript_14420:1572-2264(-)
MAEARVRRVRTRRLGADRRLRSLRRLQPPADPGLSRRRRALLAREQPKRAHVRGDRRALRGGARGAGRLEAVRHPPRGTVRLPRRHRGCGRRARPGERPRQESGHQRPPRRRVGRRGQGATRRPESSRGPRGEPGRQGERRPRFPDVVAEKLARVARANVGRRVGSKSRRRRRVGGDQRTTRAVVAPPRGKVLRPGRRRRRRHPGRRSVPQELQEQRGERRDGRVRRSGR